MVTTIFIGVFAIIALISVVVAVKASKTIKSSDQYEDDAVFIRRAGIITGSVTGALAVIVLFVSTFTVIGATNVGVPISFGQVGEPLNPGVHFVAPWVRVEDYPTRPVTVELAGENLVLARTAGAGALRVEVAVRWKVDPSRAKDLYLQVRTGDDDRISREIVEKNLRQAVGEIYQMTANLDATQNRDKVTADILARLNTQLDAYGITIEDVNLRSVEPDDKTAETISQLSRQEQATRIAEEGKRTAAVEAERRSIEAEGIRLAAELLAGIAPTAADILCQQAWERQQGAANSAGRSLFTTPCGNGGTGIVVQP